MPESDTVADSDFFNCKRCESKELQYDNVANGYCFDCIDYIIDLYEHPKYTCAHGYTR